MAVVDDPQCVTSKQTRAFCFTVERMQVRPCRKLGKENTLACDEGRQEQFCDINSMKVQGCRIHPAQFSSRRH